MITQYSEAQVAEFTAFYEEHGVVKLPGLIPPTVCEELLRVIDQTAARVNDPPTPTQGLSFGTFPGKMTIRHQWRENKKVRDFLLRPELVDTMARVVGTNELRLWYDLTFIHDGLSDGETGTGTAWHHDIAAFPWKGDQLPSLWMALTPSNAERSRLMFIDGSHKSVPGLYRLAAMPVADDGYAPLPDFDALIAKGEAKVLTWDCEPGDAIILHPYTVHGAKGNKGSKGSGRRVAMTTRWFGDDVRFLPTHGYKGNQIPGVTESPIATGGKPRGEYFPLAWSRKAADAKGGTTAG